MAHALESQQKEVLALRSFVALQMDTLQDQREKLVARIHGQEDRVTDLHKSYLKHTQEILPLITKHIEDKNTVQELSSDVAVAVSHFQKLHDTTISRVRDIEAKLLSSGDIELLTAKASTPLSERINQLESMIIHPKRIEKLEREHEEMFAKVEQLLDDAKKGEGYRDVIEPELSIASVLGIPHFPEFPKLTLPTQGETSVQSKGKRKQEEETDEQFRAVKRLNLGKTGDIIAELTKPVFTVAPNQTLVVFGKAGLMVSHAVRTEFEHRDKWVPRELNNWWERQKEVFIKWFYVFSNFPRDGNTRCEAWRYFWNNHCEQNKVKTLLRANENAGKSKFIKIPDYRTVTPPKTGRKANKEAIREEVSKLCTIHKVDRTRKPQIYQEIKNVVFNVYDVLP